MWPTLRRLLGLWREQGRWVALGLTCAFAYTALSLAIPILIQRAIDHAIVPGDTSQLLPYMAAIMALSVVRFVINFTRRSATARIGVHIEARMRELLYDAYLCFPRAFYDRHSTGQVVSRATNDLYPIRYFIGWGIVQGAQSAMMIVGAGIVLTIVDPLLALYTGLSMPLIGFVAWLFAHRVMPISRSGAVPQGGRHRGRRRGRGRDRDGAGVRPRGRRPRPLREGRRPGARHRAAAGWGRGPLPAGAAISCPASRSPRWCSSAAAT